MWLLFLASAAGVMALGLADWWSLALSPWLRFGLGLPLWAAGHGLALWAMITLGLATSFGGQGALVRRGPYRFSRNPQYLGFILALLGWPLLAASALTLLASLVGIVPLLLVPLAEEPWLAARHGPAYRAYTRAVPRFLPLRRQPDGP
jgi:protein-S-isoprenylcysteine O-methyltransferase Ste14